MNVAETEHQRQYFRLCLEIPLCSDMTIVMINGKTLDIGTADVLIEDIGPGGLRFLTSLALPVNSQVVLQFETEVLNQKVKMHGFVVRSSKLLEGINEYAVEFTMEEEKHTELARIMNRLAIRLKQSSSPPSGRFLKGDRLAFFRSKEQEQM